jgi:hypothetical protein
MNFQGLVQRSNLDPAKSSILSSPFFTPPPPVLLCPLTRTGPLLLLPDGAGDPSGDFTKPSVSPTIRSITFALAPARLNLSSKSATASSVFAVSNVRGSVREWSRVVLEWRRVEFGSDGSAFLSSSNEGLAQTVDGQEHSPKDNASRQ